MHPALSVIFFTVLSGAGYGLFMLVAVLHLTGSYPDASSGELQTQLAVALVLITIGLLSSSLHLHNPRNAWRAFMRVRASWLSREAVLAVAFYPFALWYAWEVRATGGDVGQAGMIMGVIAVLLAGLTVFSTGMIYASLKTIRQWHTALTPANYLLLGLALGGLALVAIHGWFVGDDPLLGGIAIALLVLAAIMKGIYFLWIREVTGPTINTATGFTRAPVRILDPGHTAGTFLTREFGFDPGRRVIQRARLGVFALGFALPILLLAWVLSGAPAHWLTLALVSALAGIGLERWLFFAEARHAVMLYHGRQHT
ncbi:dimethyl sulfoxide reductase anchor subunit [Ectothiorhodospira haloalkaliphila]|uniref:dimethyl sulfoxide reductase anchor subunit family protein n=1 Tax=Ectothiorhodospira haloalkaliphila TaxID=421628 RepID=UPI001EE972EC|nr:DmsC/YnfH family molybdoenzyme membrane anchor subunit [Ectothiorhodospira haloalkaliphila]MCG5523899.1 dimethyl sulfoxide reductase anchor subunit [Ectothiorhodospira haloalkaliphila]